MLLGWVSFLPDLFLYLRLHRVDQIRTDSFCILHSGSCWPRVRVARFFHVASCPEALLGQYVELSEWPVQLCCCTRGL